MDLLRREIIKCFVSYNAMFSTDKMIQKTASSFLANSSGIGAFRRFDFAKIICMFVVSFGIRDKQVIAIRVERRAVFQICFRSWQLHCYQSCVC